MNDEPHKFRSLRGPTALYDHTLSALFLAKRDFVFGLHVELDCSRLQLCAEHNVVAPQRCAELRLQYPGTKWWKALRLRGEADLNGIDAYAADVDALLLDAWSPKQLGGTGHRLDPAWLERLETRIGRTLPWWLAGGISAEWVPTLVHQVSPFGLDASSRLEHSPGVKDLRRVEALVEAVRVNSGNRG